MYFCWDEIPEQKNIPFSKQTQKPKKSLLTTFTTASFSHKTQSSNYVLLDSIEPSLLCKSLLIVKNYQDVFFEPKIIKLTIVTDSTPVYCQFMLTFTSYLKQICLCIFNRLVFMLSNSPVWNIKWPLSFTILGFSSFEIMLSISSWDMSGCSGLL